MLDRQLWVGMGLVASLPFMKLAFFCSHLDAHKILRLAAPPEIVLLLVSQNLKYAIVTCPTLACIILWKL